MYLLTAVSWKLRPFSRIISMHWVRVVSRESVICAVRVATELDSIYYMAVIKYAFVILCLYACKHHSIRQQYVAIDKKKVAGMLFQMPNCIHFMEIYINI